MFFKPWLILLNILLLQPVTCSSIITCSAGVATIGGPATVTCNFNRDIKSTQTNFVVWKFPINTADLYDSTYRTDVLNCNWVKEKLNCITADGYAFEEHTVGSTASVYIPSATADQEGIYKCQLATQEIIQISTCNLAIQAKEGNQVSQGISSFISYLTSTGAFSLIVGFFFFSCFVTIFYCRKHTCRRQVDHAVQTKVDSAERGITCEILTSKPTKADSADIGIDTEDLPDHQPAAKGWSIGFFSRSLLPKHNRQSFDNTHTYNDGFSSPSMQPSKSLSMQSLTATIHDEEGQQHQPFLQSKLYPPLPPVEPINRYPDTTYPATSDMQPLHGESHKDEVESVRVETLVNLETIDDYPGTCQNDPDTTQDDNGKGPEKDKKGRMRKVLSLLTKL